MLLQANIAKSTSQRQGLCIIAEHLMICSCPRMDNCLQLHFCGQFGAVISPNNLLEHLKSILCLFFIESKYYPLHVLLLVACKQDIRLCTLVRCNLGDPIEERKVTVGHEVTLESKF